MGQVLFNNSLFVEAGGSGAKIQLKTMPTASSKYDGKIVQYVGETTTDYVNGYFYKCITNLVSSAVTEGITITQTAGTDMGDFVVDLNTYKTETNSSTEVKSFSFIGNPTKVEAWNMNTLAQITLDRENSMDTRNTYGWIDDTNTFYWTNTTNPDMNTEFYSDSNLETGTGYTYLSTTARATSGFSGYWSYTNDENSNIDLLNDFGIGNDMAPSVGVTITAQYHPASDAVYNSTWTRINVQPSGGGTGGIEYTDLHATSPITYNNTNGTYGVLTATNSNLGVVKPDGTTITVDANGVITSVGSGEAVDDVKINGTSIVDANRIANIPTATASSLGVSKATQVTTMPTASATYAGQVVKFIGTTTSDYEQGLNYICEEQGGSYSWNYLPADLIASTTDFGLVKPDGTTITINNGVITAQGTAGAKLYTLDGLSITSTNVDIRTLVQAVVAKNLPIGSIVTGSVQLTDAPADNMTDAMVEIVAYQLTEGSSTDTIYDITLNSRVESPYQWHAEYWVGHPTADVGWVEAPLAFYNMPTASATYATNGGKIAQYVGPGDGLHLTGKFYKCQEVTPVTDPATYEWVLVHVEPVGSSSDFGIVKVDNSSIIANSGVITANKATGNYSVSFVGNPSTTTSALNVGANSTAHGWYATAIGCDAVVGDSANDVRVPGAIQLGRGSNQEAGSLSVGLSVNGTSWNNYTLLGSDGIIPTARIANPTTITNAEIDTMFA